MLTVYSKNNCPFCEQAKGLLTKKGISFDVVKIDEDNEAREWLLEQRHRTVPQLYLDGKLFVEGGYQGLAKLSDEELTARLAGA
jgi:glutaredoxin 3